MHEGLLKPMVSFVGGGKVNYYFNNAFNLFWNTGAKDAFLTFKNKYPDCNILITGHSLGAVEAVVCTGITSALKYVDPFNLALITFGGPKVGDKDFVDAINRLIPEPYRVTHTNGLIPHLPIAGLFGYTHIASEVW